jgi:hypothetical protein
LKKEGSSLAALCGCVYSREKIISRFLKLHYKYFPSQGFEYVQFADEVLMSDRRRNRLARTAVLVFYLKKKSREYSWHFLADPVFEVYFSPLQPTGLME